MNKKLPAARPFFLQFSIKEQVLFAKRLSVLIQAGVPIVSALGIMSKQTGSKGATYIITRVVAEVEQGQLLSSGLRPFQHIFGEFAVNIIQVGEVSGTLYENLEYLSQELKKKLELKRKIVSALVYPVFIIVATLGITGLLTGYVFPKIMPVFLSFKMQLPWSTRVLMRVSFIVSRYGEYIMLGLVLAVVGTLFLLRQPRVRLWFDTVTLKIPLVGTMFQNYYLTNFCRTLGLLLKSDVKIVEAVKIVASTTANLAYRRQFSILSEHILRGEKISDYVSQQPILFPSILTQMLMVGEVSGNLSQSLLYLAGLYEDELNDLSKNLTTVVEPALMMFMGLIVGFVAISIITPIYGITQNLHQ